MQLKRWATFLLAVVSTALAYPGSVPASARLHAQASSTSPLLATLPAKASLDILSCTATWCEVTAQGKTGWLERPRVKARYGRCTELSKVGLFDIKKTEASYTPGLDRDKDGVGCNRVR
ncbi:hypothetical protein GCM10010840_06580 [Deinococcus aerolatus]|uniref:Excalibur calcium-binding domain-containing protein n=1 Tax=Deinococcus aerolatus TaxID=522487 RepID=A0ABQ2G1Y8_9DEIO|nr:SH3 domain-containing protein [Deinococcus aerolatus]GGL71184.1 hypothetical protein GCM10010840_06580 [Deinococcus aerolatus]